jgi:uncharacterized membrane protein YbhN (UPF0104 family)
MHTAEPVKTIKKTSKNTYSLIAKIVISAGLIIFLIYKLNFKDIYSAVKNADYNLIALSFLLMFVNIFLQYIKWKLSAEKVMGPLDKKQVFDSLLYGLSGGAFTPARLGEYWGRSLALKKYSFLQVTTATLLDKLFPMAIVVLSGISGTAWLYFITGKTTVISPGIITGLSVIIVSLIIIASDKTSIIIPWLRKVPYIKKQEDILQSLSGINRRFSAKMMLVSVFFVFCYIFQLALLFAAFSHEFMIGKYIQAAVMVMFSKTLLGAVSISEFGVREGASIYFLGLLGGTPETAFNASVFIFLINVAVPSFAGMLLMMAGKNAK